MAVRRTSYLGSGAWWQPVWAAWSSWLGNSKTFRQQVGFWEEEIDEGSSRQDQGSDLLASIAATQLCWSCIHPFNHLQRAARKGWNDTAANHASIAATAALGWCWRNLKDLLNESLAALTKVEVVVLSYYVLWDNLSVGISDHGPGFIKGIPVWLSYTMSNPRTPNLKKRSQVFIPSNTDSWLLPTLRWFGFLGWYFPSSARVSRFSAHLIYRIFYCTFNTKFTHPLHKSMLNQFKNYCSAFWSLPWYMIVPVFIIIDIIILLLII